MIASAETGNNLTNLLHEVGKLLPDGSNLKIGKMCGKSKEYVRLFFKGTIPITEENIKILDAAEKLIDEMKEEEAHRLIVSQRASKKAEVLINKAKEE